MSAKHQKMSKTNILPSYIGGFSHQAFKIIICILLIIRGNEFKTNGCYNFIVLKYGHVKIFGIIFSINGRLFTVADSR